MIDFQQIKFDASDGIEPWVGADVDRETFAVALYIDPRPGTPDLKLFPTSRFDRNAQGVGLFLQWTTM